MDTDVQNQDASILTQAPAAAAADTLQDNLADNLTDPLGGDDGVQFKLLKDSDSSGLS